MNGSRAKTVCSLLDRGYADAELVGVERVPASRALLAALSPALEVRLARQTVVEVEGAKTSVLRAVRDYSCGTALRLDTMPAEDLTQLAAFAKSFRIDSLSALCAVYVKDEKPSPASSSTTVTSKPAKEEANGGKAAAPKRWAMEAGRWTPDLASLGGLGALADSPKADSWAKSVALVCALLSFFSYLPAMSTNHYRLGAQNGGFFMDDAPAVARNPSVISDTLDWKLLRTTDYWGLPMFDPTQWTHKSFRPLTTLSFRLNYQLHGMDSTGWWFSNVLYHFLAAILLGVVAYRVFCIPGSWSIWAGALFAVHPVHAENIMYLVGRADILCQIALCLAFLIYDWSGRCNLGADWYNCTKLMTQTSWAGFLISMVLIVVAGLCKETGFTMFGVVVIAELYDWQKRGLREGKQHCGARVGAALIFGTLACMWRVWYTDGTGIVRMDPMSNPMAACDDGYTRKLSYAFVHGVYWKLLIFPLHLCYDYSMDSIPLITTVTDCRNALSLAAYVATFAVAHLCVTQLRYRASMGKALILALALFALSFLPMSSILFVVGTVVGERLLYIPSAAMVFAVCACCAQATKARPRVSPLLTLLALGVWAFWGVRCYYRTTDWADADAITLNDGLRSLRSSRTQFNLGNYYLQRNMLDEAQLAYTRSIKADPEERDASPLWHSGQIHILRGEWAQAESQLRKAVNGYFSPLVMPEEEVFHDLGLACSRIGKPEEAIYYIQAAVSTNPMLSKGWNNLGCEMVTAGLARGNQQVVAEGLQAVDRAIQINAHNVLYWRNAAALLMMVGDQQAAGNAFNQVRALEGNPNAQLSGECVWEFYLR